MTSTSTQAPTVNSFAGKWKLQNSENFEEFLIFYGYGFLKRKAALVANAVMTLSVVDDRTLNKNVDSTFLKLEERVETTGCWSKPNSEGLVKMHNLMSNTKMFSTVQQSKSVTWNEYTEVVGDKLTVTREWGNGCRMTQTFTRLS